MEKTIEELRKENNEEVLGYLAFVKDSVEDRSYFKDGLNWYFFRYLLPICDRTLLIFSAIIGVVILFCLVQMFQSALPLVEKIPIFVYSKDQANYFPHLVQLRLGPRAKSITSTATVVDEYVARYLIADYVKNREGYDFSSGKIEDVNTKIVWVKNTSSNGEYDLFQKMIDKDNPKSPVNYLGMNIKKVVNVESVNLIRRTSTNLTEKVRVFFQDRLPFEADVKFATTLIIVNTHGVVTKVSERYLVKIIFGFGGIKKDKSGNLDFVVKSYRLFRFK